MSLFNSDIKFIANRPLLLTALVLQVIFTLLLLHFFPFISGLTRLDNAFLFDRYYTVTGITLIAGIPFIYGLLFSFINLKELHSVNNAGDLVRIPVTKTALLGRMSISAILSFIILLPLIYITDAVSTEGWLRSIYAAFLLAITAPFIFLFTSGFARDRKSWRIISLISVIFLITLPSGLLLHHPWNYFIFFSPYYWTGWAWVIASPSESILYGMISLAISVLLSLMCYRHIFRKSERA